MNARIAEAVASARDLCRLCFIWIRGAVLLTLALPGLTPSAWAAGPALELQDSTPVVQVWPAVTVLSDPGKLLKLEQVMQMKTEFKPPQTAYGTLGLRQDAVWLHIQIGRAHV